MIESKESVLVIDDEPTFCELVAQILEAEGYEVFVAHSVEEAEPFLKSKKISAILLDIVMPGESGVAYLERLQRKGDVPPIVMVTGHPNMSTAVRSIKSGALDYLSKPIDPDMLVATVRKAVEISITQRSERTVMLSDGAKFIGGYRIKRVLGVGTMGMVYLAEKPGQRDGPDEYALKVLKRFSAQSEKELEYVRERFILEAKATHRINHPNVVRVYDFGTTETDLPYILLEYCPGKTLEKLINEDALSLPEKCRVLMQVALALEAVHQQDICHRDVKPSNVIVRDDMLAKLTDFGIARLHDSNLTMTSEVFGSPAFLSPEGFQSAKVDHRADIFSFGSLAYQLFTGNLPFEGDDISIISNKIRNEDPVWPKQVQSTFPMPLEAILKKMMAKDPADRYQTAQDVYSAISSFMKKAATSTVRVKRKGKPA